jgi:hypothetical protein
MARKARDLQRRPMLDLRFVTIVTGVGAEVQVTGLTGVEEVSLMGAVRFEAEEAVRQDGDHWSHESPVCYSLANWRLSRIQRLERAPYQIS